MFIKIKNQRINLDNVSNYWFKDKEDAWTTNGEVEIQHIYLLNIEYVGIETTEEIKFKTKEEWETAKVILDDTINPVDICPRKE